MGKKRKNGQFLKRRMVFVILFLLLGVLFVNFLFLKPENISPQQAIDNIFHNENQIQKNTGFQSDSFFSSQKIQLGFSTLQSMQDVTIQGTLDINSFFDKKDKDEVKLYFKMSDQVGDNSVISGGFIRISDNQKRYFFINDFVLTGSTGIQQFPIGQEILGKMLKKWVFLEKDQEFGLLTKDFDLHRFILYTPRLLSFLPQHINIGSGKVQYKTIPFFDKYLPKVSKLLRDKFYRNGEQYKISMKDKELLLLFFGLPPTLTMNDLLKFDAYLNIEGEDSYLTFTGLSFYKLPYNCNGYLDSYEYKFNCVNSGLEESFLFEVSFVDKKIYLDYKYPEIQLKLDGGYNFFSEDKKNIFKYNGLVSIQHDDLLYHRFVDIDSDLSIVLSDDTADFDVVTGSKSLFDILK